MYDVCYATFIANTNQGDCRYYHYLSANPTLFVLLLSHTLLSILFQYQITCIRTTIRVEKNENYGKEVSISSTLLNNLCSALESASIDKSSTKHRNGTMEPVTKRMKIESNSDVTVDRDVFNILDPSFSRGKDIVHREGAIIARLTTGGLMNALAGKPGGIVDNTSGEPLEGTKANLIDTAQNVTMSIIKSKAMGLSHIIAARLEIDMMQSTPKRIVEMLCPELTVTEILGIRRRIYDTVILGKGTNASANAEALENRDDLPVAARTGMHDIDKVSPFISQKFKLRWHVIRTQMYSSVWSSDTLNLRLLFVNFVTSLKNVRSVEITSKENLL